MRILPLLLLVASGTTQSPLFTTFANNGGSAIGGAVYYDLTVLNPLGVTITSLDINLSSPVGTVGTIDVFVIPGSRVGFTTSQAGWLYFGPGTVTAAGPGQPSAVVLFQAIPLSAGSTTGWALVGGSTAHAYTNGGGAVPLVYSNADLMLTAGESSNAPFTPLLFSPRVVNANHHYTIGGMSTFATNETLGLGCDAFASTYELFGSAASFDLANTCMTFTPNGPGYTVTNGGAFLPTGSIGPPQILSFATSPEVTVPLTMMGVFPALTGALTSLTICENGLVSAAAGNGCGFNPSLAGLLNGNQTVWATWHDFHPSGGGTIEFEESATVSMVTWNNVPDFGGGPLDTSTMQIQFHGSGVVRWCWQTMSTQGNGYLVGYSPGGPSLDPGNSDYSSALAGASIELEPIDQGALVLSALTRPVLGTTWFLELTNIPPSAAIAINIFGTSDPGILDLAFLGMPGCQLRSSLDILQGPFVGPAPAWPLSFAIPSTPSLLYFELFTQSAVFQVPRVNAFGAITSNGIKGTLAPL